MTVQDLYKPPAWTPAIVSDVNIKICDKIAADTKADPGTIRYGVILMDFPEQPADDLIYTLIMTNSIKAR